MIPLGAIATAVPRNSLTVLVINEKTAEIRPFSQGLPMSGFSADCTDETKSGDVIRPIGGILARRRTR